MIFVTGDTHGDFRRLSPAAWPLGSTLTKSDFVIILGDFGGLWKAKLDPWESRDLDLLGSRPFTTLFLDGNHENFDRLEALPTEKKFGGVVGKIRTRGGYIYHLKRGQVYQIDGKSIFTMGGAFSIDREYRTLDISWWEQEMITDEQLREAYRNLAKVDNRVDYILTHCPPVNAIYAMGIKPFKSSIDINPYYVQNIADIVTFDHWYFGHMHQDKNVAEKFTCMYQEIVELGAVLDSSRDYNFPDFGAFK